MTLRDPRNIPPLSAGDLAGLELLDADRDASGEGVTRAELELAIGTRWVSSFVKRASKHGRHVVIASNGRYQVGHDEPVSREAPASGRPGGSHDAGLPVPVLIQAGAGASLDTDRLFPLPAASHYESERAA